MSMQLHVALNTEVVIRLTDSQRHGCPPVIFTNCGQVLEPDLLAFAVGLSFYAFC